MDDYAKCYRLMCPGPVNVSKRVFNAMISSEIGHREKEFSTLLTAIRRNCLEVMNLSEKEYSLVVITGSGSAGNEAVISSAIQPHDHVLSLATGEFGQRLGQISSIYNPNTTIHRQDWATPLDLAKVEELLKKQHFDWVTMVHNETSTGELQPVYEVGQLCKKYGAKLFVDAVSSFMADPLDLKACNVTFMNTSSGKAIGMGPGLALVVGRIDEFEKLSSYPVRNYYLSLARHYDFYKNKLQTPNTPAISLFFALNEAFKIIIEEGAQNRLQYQALKARTLRTSLLEKGLRIYRPDHVLSNAVTSVCLPEHMDFDTLRQALRDRGFIVYGGKGPLANKIFQISTMGYVDCSDVNDLVEAIHEAIAESINSSVA
ncbi:MAG: alanine--glyoxylate aminotransferase family protein [Proteobacteria bacterium]|nr:alanine--glyoxylate aminotransferase family protein [Pseudomonadota bacterium]